MSKRRNPFDVPLMMIEWDDHTSSDEWVDEASLSERSGAARIFTVGWLIKEDADVYVLAAVMEKTEDAYSNIMSILKKAVRSKRTLMK